MADRAPTDWYLIYSEPSLSPGQPIKATVPNLIADNQQYCVERDQLLLSTTFCPYPIDSTSWVTILDDFAVVGPNTLGLSATEALTGSTVYAWVDDALSTFEVRLYDAVYGALTHTVTGTTKKWWGSPAGVINAPSTGAIWTFDLQARRTEGEGVGYVAGVGLFYS